MKKHQIILLLYVIAGLAARAQTTSEARLMGELYIPPITFHGNNFYGNYWTKGSILLTDGKKASDIDIKIDIYLDQIVFYNDPIKRTFTIQKETIDTVYYTDIMGHNMKFARYSGDELLHLKQGQLVHWAYNGSINIYARYTALVDEADEVGEKDKLYRKDYFFIQKPGEKIMEMKINRKQILALYPEQKKEIRKLLFKYPVRRDNLNDFIIFIKILENR
jgi:hypothetical protein